MVGDPLWRDKSAVVENGLGYSEFVIDEELLSKIHLNSNLVNMRFLVISPVTWTFGTNHGGVFTVIIAW